MPPMYVLLKPVSGNCNMRCEYCFYHSIIKQREMPPKQIMSPDTVKNVVKSVLSTAQGECTFAFQGGEPTLAGIAFYREFHDLVNTYNRQRLKIHWVIQTNGYVIDREWATFLKENHYLVGLSVDGNKDTHDRYRLDVAGKGTFSKTLRAAQLLSGGGVPVNILTVVTQDLAQRVARVYGFYKRNHFFYQQFIPCLEPLNSGGDSNPPYLPVESYGEFLCKLFDLWYRDVRSGERISIRYFDNLVMMLRGQIPEGCGMLGHCTRQIVVETDGTVYPCDFYCLDEYALGNLNHNSFSDLEAKRDEIGFIQQSLLPARECESCHWKAICRGGCRRDREPMSDYGLSRNRYCKAYQQFFNYSYPRLREVAGFRA